MAVAVIHSLDVGFNKGKGKILETWTEAISDGLLTQKEPVKQIVTERTLAFFDSLPKFTKEEK